MFLNLKYTFLKFFSFFSLFFLLFLNKSTLPVSRPCLWNLHPRENCKILRESSHHTVSSCLSCLWSSWPGLPLPLHSPLFPFSWGPMPPSNKYAVLNLNGWVCLWLQLSHEGKWYTVSIHTLYTKDLPVVSSQASNSHWKFYFDSG